MKASQRQVSRLTTAMAETRGPERRSWGRFISRAVSAGGQRRDVVDVADGVLAVFRFPAPLPLVGLQGPFCQWQGAGSAGRRPDWSVPSRRAHRSIIDWSPPIKATNNVRFVSYKYQSKLSLELEWSSFLPVVSLFFQIHFSYSLMPTLGWRAFLPVPLRALRWPLTRGWSSSKFSAQFHPQLPPYLFPRVEGVFIAS